MCASQTYLHALFLFVIVGTCSATHLPAADKVNWEELPIRYSEREPTRNAIVHLQEQLDASKLQLQHAGAQGYLRSVLAQLNIPISSQVLVFSKTSLQDDKISPQQPRAIYFNDETHVGFVQGGLIEIATADADLGMVFYTLDPEHAERPKFYRQANRCLSCHGAARTKGVPGLLIRSVYPNSKGEPVVKAGSFLSNHRSPLAQRWGGWFVTGTHGDQQHLGNFILAGESKPKVFENQAGMNVNELGTRCDTASYLSVHSDLVALMVLEHQIEAYNLLTQANFVAQHALWEKQNAIAAGTEEAQATEKAEGRIQSSVQPLVQYLLFAQEAKLSAPLAGTANFQQEFEARHTSATGCRVAEFDLKQRMFKVPLSYLIYSNAFASQPVELRRALAAELLAATESGYPFSKQIGLSDSEREAIRAQLQQSPPAWFGEN